MIMNKLLLTTLIFSFTLLSFSGCSRTIYLNKNKSHFDYPNSNVEQIGSRKITGEAKTGAFFYPPAMNNAIQERAYQDALSKVNDADLLIDVELDYKTTSFLYFYTGTLKVEGFPAKMEIGEQKLN